MDIENCWRCPLVERQTCYFGLSRQKRVYRRNHLCSIACGGRNALYGSRPNISYREDAGSTCLEG